MAISSRFGSDYVGLEEEGNSSLYFSLSLSDLFFSFSYARILDSTSIIASCMESKVVDLLSLNRRDNSTSKEFSNVILAKDLIGLISSWILLYILLNLFMKSDKDSPLFLLKAPNSVI
jgi:hypothetical protein